MQALDVNMQYDVIYTDFSKAFDKISHKILLYKLAAYGITCPLLEWLKSYLTGREFFVVINGFRSTNRGINSGAPQGSHLAPVLFNIFINDLPECFHFSECFLYADDLKFARRIEFPKDSELLQEDMNRVIEWCNNNKMQLNTEKCYHIKFTRKAKCLSSDYFIENNKIQEVTTIKDLGVTFDIKLTLLPHIENIIKKASRMLGFVIRNSREFKSGTKILLYNSLVRSTLDYCSVVWRPHYADHILRIERVQKRFLWHLAYSTGKAKLLKSYTSRLQYFNTFTIIS